MKTDSILRRWKAPLVAMAAAGTLGLGFAVPALAQDQRLPDSFNYNLKNGKPVPKGQRTVNPDGSWREVVSKGQCVKIKEKTASGEVRYYDECKPK